MQDTQIELNEQLFSKLIVIKNSNKPYLTHFYYKLQIRTKQEAVIQVTIPLDTIYTQTYEHVTLRNHNIRLHWNSQ